MRKRKVRAIGILVAILSISTLSGCGTSKQKQVKTARTTQESNVTEKKNLVKNIHFLLELVDMLIHNIHFHHTALL